jgi:hypothetical protein
MPRPPALWAWVAAARCSTLMECRCSPSGSRSPTGSWRIHTAQPTCSTCFQYGIHAIAGPGFGVWRELAANMIVTEGASPVRRSLSRCCTTGGYYPAVHRIASEHLDIDAVVAQFGGAPAVRIRLEDLAGATASLVLPAALRRRHPRRVSRPIVCSRDPADRPYACRRARSTAAMPCRRQFRAPPQGQYRTGGRVRPERIPV